jgi:hypothetical protein
MMFAGYFGNWFANYFGDDEDEPAPEPESDFRRVAYGPQPRRDPPRFSPVMAACMLWVGAQQSGLSSRNDMTSNTLHGKA